MTHYEVLGVARTAPVDEIRQAYLRLAREHHPDRHGDPERMQAVNAAWRELSDVTRRRRYDELLDGPVQDEQVATWHPFDDGDDDEPDPRLDDSLARRPTAGRLLALAPVTFLVTGLGAVVVGGVAALRPLMGLGFVLLAVALLLFVAAPIAVVLESRRHDHL